MDNKNTHPTKESLQADLDNIQAELNKPVPPTEAEVAVAALPDNPADPQPETVPQVDASVKDTEQPADISTEAKDQIETPEVIEEPKDEPKKELPSTEERYKESTKEAQRLYKSNAEINKAITDANSLPLPTDEELKAEYPDWDLMDDTQKRLATSNLVNERRWQAIDKASQAQRSIEEWTDKTTKFVEDPRSLIDHPELEGKTTQFKEFADNPENKGVNFNTLVSAFLFETAKNKPAPKKGQMFETGTGGDNQPIKPKSNKISLEEATVLMNSNYDKYKEYVKLGLIDMTV